MVSAYRRGNSSYLAILAALILLTLAVPAAASPTTEVHVVRYAADGVTILNETTIDYHWMEANLPVLGDGVTHYYHQGPVFETAWTKIHPDEPYDPWNPEEDINVQEKDMGAVKGTDLADLCNLVGGMAEEETVKIRATDGMTKTFPYGNVYEPESRQGPIVVTWYKADEGYVPDYYTGMRLIFFADTSTNPNGTHALGVWDMHECFDEDYWYFFQPDLPTTTGLSVQYISEITIYSNEEPTGSIRVTSAPSGAVVYIDDEETGSQTPCTLSGIETGSHALRVGKEGFVEPDEVWISVAANAIAEAAFNLTAETGSIAVSSVPVNASIFLDGNATGFSSDATLETVPVGEHTIELVLPGYRNATRTVVVEKEECSSLDVVLFLESSSQTEFAPEIANATGSKPGLPQFAVLGPFEFHGRFEAVRANVSAGPDETTVEYRNPGTAWGRWYLYTANTSTGTPAFEDGVPDRRYADGAAETCAANFTPGDETFVVHCPPDASAEGLILVVGTDENASAVTCWIGEGVLAPGISHRLGFDGTLDPVRTDAARLTIVGGGNTSVTFNGHAVTSLQQDSSDGSLRIAEYDVLPYLNVSANEVLLKADGETIRNVIFAVTAGEEPQKEIPAQSSPANPVEAFIAGILDFLSGIFPSFGSSGEAPGEQELDSTPVTQATPVPEETPALPVVTPGAEDDGIEDGRSGGLYVESYPEGMTIVVDNRELDSRTPHVVYGLREGLHSIGVEAETDGEESDYRFETSQAWVYPEAVTPVSLDGVAVTGKKTIRVDSEIFRGERFTVNGLFPAGTIPGDAGIEGAKSWVTVFRNGTFLSFTVPNGIEANGTYRIEAQNENTVTVSVGSSPEGAQVFVEGSPPGSTPRAGWGVSPPACTGSWSRCPVTSPPKRSSRSQRGLPAPAVPSPARSGSIPTEISWSRVRSRMRRSTSTAGTQGRRRRTPSPA
jgi:hypothetical protein